jgi:hypothetical protein
LNNTQTTNKANDLDKNSKEANNKTLDRSCSYPADRTAPFLRLALSKDDLGGSLSADAKLRAVLPEVYKEAC